MSLSLLEPPKSLPWSVHYQFHCQKVILAHQTDNFMPIKRMFFTKHMILSLNYLIFQGRNGIKTDIPGYPLFGLDICQNGLPVHVMFKTSQKVSNYYRLDRNWRIINYGNRSIFEDWRSYDRQLFEFWFWSHFNNKNWTKINISNILKVDQNPNKSPIIKIAKI